jgi:hypothetical protein
LVMHITGRRAGASVPRLGLMYRRNQPRQSDHVVMAGGRRSFA